MRKVFPVAIFTLVLAGVFVILFSVFPKNTGVLIFFLILLFLDLYLWTWVRNVIARTSRWFQKAVVFLFWLPLILLSGVIIFGFSFPFIQWNPVAQTYVISGFFAIFLCSFFPILFLLLADLIGGSVYLLHRLIPGKLKAMVRYQRSNRLVSAGWIIGGLFFLLMGCGMIFWKYDFKVTQQIINLPELPVSFEGTKIVQVSDIHLGSWTNKRKLEEVVEQVNQLRPDIIFFTGDMFNYTTKEGTGFKTILKRLHAPLGIIAILGNHDYGDYITWSSPSAKVKNMEDLVVYYKLLGWKLLRNENVILRKGADSIAILGVENWGSTRRFQRFGDIGKAQKGTGKMAIRILLSHDPSHWDRIISRYYPSIDLTLSGHTHGGQFGIDLPGIHWSPVSWMESQWCGLYAVPRIGHPQYLYVNQGLGCIGYSGRIGILPEITLFTLKRVK